MKLYLSLLMLLGTAIGLRGQNAQLTPEVLSSGGGFGHPSPSDASVSYTLGEVVVATFNSGSYLTQGFHQPELVVTMVAATAPTVWQLEVYPNPTSQVLNLRALHCPSPDFAWSLTDIAGLVLDNARLTTDQCRIDLSHVASGNYFLKVTEAATQSSQVFKIVKSN